MGADFKDLRIGKCIILSVCVKISEMVAMKHEKTVLAFCGSCVCCMFSAFCPGWKRWQTGNYHYHHQPIARWQKRLEIPQNHLVNGSIFSLFIIRFLFSAPNLRHGLLLKNLHHLLSIISTIIFAEYALSFLCTAEGENHIEKLCILPIRMQCSPQY